MARGVQISLTLNPRDFIRGLKLIESDTEKVIDALEDMEDVDLDIDTDKAERGLEDLEDAAEDAERAFQDLSDEAQDEFRDMERYAEDAGREIENELEDAVDDVETSFSRMGSRFSDEMRDMEQRADRAGNNIENDLRDSTDGVGSVGSEYADEFVENWGEGVRSGDLGGVITETLTQSAQVIGNALRGPAGIAAGIGVAAVAGIIVGIEQRRQALIDALRAPIEEGLDSSVDEAVETGRLVSEALGDAFEGADFAREQIDALNEALGEGDWTASREQILEWLPALNEAGLRLDDLILGLVGVGTEQQEAARRFQEAADAANVTRSSQQRYGNTLTDVNRIVQNQSQVLRDSAADASLADAAVLVLTDSADRLAASYDDAADSVRDLNGEFATTDEKIDDWRESMREARETANELTEGGAEPLANGLRVSSEAGLEAKDTLRGLAESGLEAAAAQIELNGDTAAAAKTTQKARDRFIEVATQLGLTKKEANKYATELGLIPGRVETSIVANGLSGVLADIDAYTTKLNNLNGRTFTTTQVTNIVTKRNYGPANDYGENP